MDKKHLLLIGGWSESIAYALESFSFVSYIGTKIKNIHFDPKILTDCYATYDLPIYRTTACLQVAIALHKIKPIDAVMSFSEDGLETAAIIAQTLSIKGLDLQAVVLTKYKDLMRKHLLDDPTLSLPYKNITDKNDVKSFYNEHGSCIVKPISGVGSYGIHKISSLKELETFIENYKDGKYKDFMVEKFIVSSTRYSIETFSSQGQHVILTATRAKEFGYPNIRDQEIAVSDFLDSQEKKAVAFLVKNFLDKIHLKNGVAHTEIKFDKHKKPYIIESQTRVGGDKIWYMCGEATGVNQIQLVYQNLLSTVEPIKDFPEIRNSYLFWPLHIAPGIIKSVSSLEKIQKQEGVIEAYISVKKGDTVKDIQDNRVRLGFVLIKAKSHEKIKKIQEIIKKEIEIIYEDGRKWSPKI